ncbi:MAG: two-component system C4-dicarboxylate transport sensor histidine kinase DctB [Pseudohongiellaceae bacterium]
MDNTSYQVPFLSKLTGLLFVFFCASLASIFFYLYQVSEARVKDKRSSMVYQQSLTSAIEQYEYLPALMAENTLVKSSIQKNLMNNQKLNRYLDFSVRESGIAIAFIMDVNGTVIGASTDTLVGNNYRYRPYYQLALKSKLRQFYYAIGSTTGVPGYFIANPIIIDGQAKGVAVAKFNLSLSRWEENWNASKENIVIADNHGVVILSANDQWRYNSVGLLSEQDMKDINAQRQFQGIQHPNIYSSAFTINIPGHLTISYWFIGKRIYVVNSYPLEGTNWTLYYLDEHAPMLYATAIFFIISSLVFALCFLYVRERQQKIYSERMAREINSQRRRELQAIVDNIHIGVVSFDDQGRVHSFNQFAKLLLSPDINEGSGYYLKNLIDMSGLPQRLERLIRDEGSTTPRYYETSVLGGSDGMNTPIMFAVSRVLISDHPIFLMTLVNIQKRKRAENELKRINENLEDLVLSRTKELSNAQEELIRQSKMAALGQMAAGVVHELSQPLTALISSIAAIKMKSEKNDWPGALQSIARITPLGEKMHTVIRLLKSFSYQDDNSDDFVDIRRVIANVVDGYADKLSENGVTISIVDQADSLLTRANPVKLDLVFTNIIQNAIDVMEHSQRKNVSITYESRDGWHQINIEDTGGGVESEAMLELFTPYFSTKDVGKGLGLGLSISYEIIQSYGGDIIVGNTKCGARFIVRLPSANKTLKENVL